LLQSAAASIQQQYTSYSSLFVWHDGPLVQAMKSGDLFLIDEISLAGSLFLLYNMRVGLIKILDDAVLERLNSVLEPHRLLVLAEKVGRY